MSDATRSQPRARVPATPPSRSPEDAADAGERTPTASVQWPQSPTRCPYCHAAIELERETWTVCGQCLARHHSACFDEHQACSSCGSEQRLVHDQPEAHGREDLRRRLRQQLRQQAGPETLRALAQQLCEAGYSEQQAWTELAQGSLRELKAQQRRTLMAQSSSVMACEALALLMAAAFSLWAGALPAWVAMASCVLATSAALLVLALRGKQQDARRGAFNLALTKLIYFCVSIQVAFSLYVSDWADPLQPKVTLASALVLASHAALQSWRLSALEASEDGDEGL